MNHRPRPVLGSGLALRSGGDVLVEPACCGDLADRSEWRGAAAYRQPRWKLVWVGHPWVSARHEAGRLVLSGQHESATPTARWAVAPEELGRAVAAAEAELEGFARNLQPALGDRRVPDAGAVARTMAGLAGCPPGPVAHAGDGRRRRTGRQPRPGDSPSAE